MKTNVKKEKIVQNKSYLPVNDKQKEMIINN